MTDTSILTAAIALIREDELTYGAAKANLDARLQMHTLVNSLISTSSIGIESQLAARAMADIVVAIITGADKAKVVSRAIADLAKICPEIAVKQALFNMPTATSREPAAA
jgi:hypothetical protein